MSGISERRILGIDLAGVTGKTGYAVLEGGSRPHLMEAALLPKEPTPLLAEESLVDLIDRISPDRLTIDAPLTLPPCLTCSDHCQGPGELCELDSARQMWSAGSNPVIRRQCEVEVKQSVSGSSPNPTMGLGIITARAVSLVRKLRERKENQMLVANGAVLEVYPAATLRRLGRSDRPPKKASASVRGTFYSEVVDGLASKIDGLNDLPLCRTNDDVFDALLAAYTGWLYPDRLEEPPKGFDLASGWIWFPKTETDGPSWSARSSQLSIFH